jgi:sulfate/thiosulfate transport system ATP-binding protein
MSFIGPVNVLPNSTDLFHRKAEEVSNNGAAHSEVVFLRPHDVLIDIKPESGFASAKISRIINLGREIQTELVLESGHTVTAYVSRERFEQLQLVREQRVYVKPKHAMTFPAYSI